MNSRQRRVDRRHWKYSVTLDLLDYDHYLEMWDWLKGRYGSTVSRCGWRDRSAYYGYDNSVDTTWQFTDEKKYVEFMLRWS
jgi:hypothetical protein